MRIALIDPPHQAFMGYRRLYFPLGLVSVGTVLASKGHEVRIFDEEHLPQGHCFSNAVATERFEHYYKALLNPNHYIWKRLRGRLLTFQPDVVGITVLSCKFDSAMFIARMVRDCVPHAKVMVGGDHTVACTAELIANECVDAVVIGEGEETAVELIEAWRECRPLQPITGIAFKDKGRVVVNPRRHLAPNLDSIPMPDRSLLHDEYSYAPQDMGLMMTSRGCPQKCKFCGISASFGRRIRFRSIEACLDEIRCTRENYGTDYFSFRDGTFTADRERTIEFCQALINECLGIGWECLTRADLLDKDLLDLMVKANCQQIRIGIESGSPRMLQYMGKDTSVEDYERAADLLNSRGVYWSAYVMMGLPEERLEDIQMTLDLLVQLRPSFVTVSRFVPLPGTVWYKDVLSSGASIDWRHQNNMCVAQSYSRHIPAPVFEQLIRAAFQFTEDYNARNAKVHGPDRRIAATSRKRREMPAQMQCNVSVDP